MATIRRYGFFSQLRSEASSYVIRYRKGRTRRSGRGLVFWFRPETSSVSEVPVDDREMTLFVRGRSQDFQTVAVQGSVGWRVVDPERLAERVDFAIDLRTGRLLGEPVEKVEARVAGLANLIGPHRVVRCECECSVGRGAMGSLAGGAGRVSAAGQAA